MTRIWIENNELDINKGLSNQITYAIDDLINIDSKATAFSKTIVLPGTANNNNLLGNIFDFNQANFTNDNDANVGYNFNAAKSANCRIEVNGLTIIKGTFRLMEIIIDGGNVEFECSVIGELGGFVSKLGALKLSDLDFSEYNHTYNVSGVTNSWNNASGGTGYYYPLIDYGNYSTLKHDWKIGTFRPALFIKQYIDKIFQAAEYTYDSDLFNTSRFKSLIVPQSQKELRRQATDILSATQGSHDVFTDGTLKKVVYFNTPSSSVFSGYGLFTYNDTTTVSLNININMYGTYYSQIGDIWCYIEKNGTFYQLISILSEDTGNQPWEINSDIQMTFSTGDTFAIYFEMQDASPGTPGTNYQVNIANSMLQVTSLVPILVPVVIGDTISLNDTIPKNILQKDFFTSILKLFNLYVYEDKYIEKHLVIKPYVDFYGDVEDWSDKIDRSKPIKLKPMSELNSRYYEFKFRSDSDYYNDLYRKRYNEGYGDRIFDSTYEFATETKSLELVFAATPLVGYEGEDKIYSTILKQSGNAPTITEENVDSNIRILQAKKITGVSSYKIYASNGTTILSTQTAYGYAGHLDNPDAPSNDINFGIPKELFFVLVSGNLSVNQFNVYYSSYMAEIADKDSKLLNCNVKLSDIDIFNLDFSMYKYIDGGLWRLFKVYDYNAGENDTTKCDFLKVINKFY
jgi:hypothetical protein